MTNEEFFNKIVEMRDAQKEFFRTRSRDVLSTSKRLEREVDAEIKNRKYNTNQLNLEL